jgi:hypothetical protein
MASASLPPRASLVLARWSRWVWATWTGWLGAEHNDRVKLRQSRGHHDHLPCCGRTDPPALITRRGLTRRHPTLSPRHLFPQRIRRNGRWSSGRVPRIGRASMRHKTPTDCGSFSLFSPSPRPRAGPNVVLRLYPDAKSS